MSIFKKSIDTQSLAAPTTEEPVKDIIEAPEPEYIWIDAYKATNPDMTCRDFQFELGKQYNIEGTPELCRNGFHCSQKLVTVFSFYPAGRYFKCRALIKKEDYKKEYITYSGPYVSLFPKYEDKFVAKSIILTEELPYEVFADHLNIAFVNSQETYNQYILDSDYVKHTFLHKTTCTGTLSEEFALFLYETIKNSSGKQIEYTAQFITGLNAEDIPHISRIQLILDFIKPSITL